MGFLVVYKQMAKAWYQAGTRDWWVTATLFFLGLEVLLRLKLGSIYVMAAAYVISQFWVESRLGLTPGEDAGKRFLFALYAALFICAVIFLVFAGLNIGLRTINNEWRWFQLP